MATAELFDHLPANRLTDWNPSAWDLASDWRALVDGFLSSGDGLRLSSFMRARIAANATIFPAQPLRALATTPLRTVKVVILGQDPYHGPGQAQGLAFSVAPGVRLPPSLINIQAEIARERRAGERAVGLEALQGAGTSGDLSSWASQGVLLLNSCLSVEQAQPGSHAKRGWEVLTDLLIKAVNEKPEPVVFMLWGAHAQSRQPLPDAAPAGAARLHLLANHPSPLSARRGPRPFMGCGHFSQANRFLEHHGQAPIAW